MRVISGTAKGTNLFSPSGIGIRPTSGAVKEALFSILSDAIYDCTFLDLFAGSGAIGIEALSRGAKRAIFVDKCADSIRTVKRNLEKTHLSEKAEVIFSDALSALKLIKKKEIKVDIAYIDPPYKFSDENVEQLIDEIVKCRIMDNKGICILEREAKNAVDFFVAGFEITKIKKYSDTVLIFMSAEEC